MPRDRWNQRKTPSDLDQPPQRALVLEFDLRRPWPQTYFGQKFGPAYIRKVINAGWLVFAEVDDIPYPVAIKETRWAGDVLEVITLEGPRVADRLFTRKSMRGVTSSGLLMERKET